MRRTPENGIISATQFQIQILHWLTKICRFYQQYEQQDTRTQKQYNNTILKDLKELKDTHSSVQNKLSDVVYDYTGAVGNYWMETGDEN